MAIGWVGRNTGPGTAFNAWAATGAGYSETVNPPMTTVSSIISTVPLTITPLLTLTTTTGGFIQPLGDLSMTNTNHPVATPVITGAANRRITLTGFPATLNAVGFFLQNFGPLAQAATATITLTDANGAEVISVPSAGVVTADNAINAGPLNGPPQATFNDAQFFGFTGIVSATQIVINNASGVRWAIGDYCEMARRVIPFTPDEGSDQDYGRPPRRPPGRALLDSGSRRAAAEAALVATREAMAIVPRRIPPPVVVAVPPALIAPNVAPPADMPRPVALSPPALIVRPAEPSPAVILQRRRNDDDEAMLILARML